MLPDFRRIHSLPPRSTPPPLTIPTTSLLRSADEMGRVADVIVTVGCGDEGLVDPGKRYLDWNLRDPERKELDEVRAIETTSEGAFEAL